VRAPHTTRELHETRREGESFRESFPWQRRAACKEFPPALFFPPGNSYLARMDEARAKAVCSSCTVRAPCLAFAIEHDEAHGVWGGLTAEERRALKATAAPFEALSSGRGQGEGAA
jgi:WhiB family transcriptional regulator, redox-sensing transcriptional regulator